jgi:hypothetical protein
MEMNTRLRRLSVVWYLTATFFLLAAAASVRAEPDPDPRISLTSQGKAVGRSGVENHVRLYDDLPALVKVGSRSKTTRASGQQKLSGGVAEVGSQTPNGDFWFYSADVDLYSDLDYDGYFAGIDVTFDADTIYSVADVYAVLYLSYELGPWNEYAYTEDFAIYGASGDDAYFIDTELVSGYPTGSYDVLIELYDIYDGSFVAEFGPDDSSQLSYLPLEDVGRDTPHSHATTVIVEQGGGSVGLLGLLALLGVAGLTWRTRDASA